MQYFLVAHIAFVIDVIASIQPEIRQCTTAPIVENSVVSLKSDDDICLQAVVVPDGHIYSAGLNDVNFCSTTDRAVTVISDTYYMHVANSPMALRVSVIYLKTTLTCHGIVPDALIGVPLTLVPTEHKCTIVLPSRTILEIRKITQTDVKDARNCARVRMGRTFYSLNHRWPAVYEIPTDDTYKYELGCSAALLDASNLAIASVEFTLHQMDEYKAVTSPLMCAVETDDVLL